jgi:hypothetical protein
VDGSFVTVPAPSVHGTSLDFAELVWCDGSKVDRKIIDLKDTTPFGTKDFKIPFDAAGKKWVRFAVWDSAGDGAYLQPIALR